MADRSFWERMGRGVGYGWKKAKKVGAQIEERAEFDLKIEDARGRLEKLYAELGRLAAHNFLKDEHASFDPSAPEVAELLRSIREGREELDRLEEEREPEPENVDEESTAQELP